MTRLALSLSAALLAATVLTSLPAVAQTVMSLDEVPVGELDPGLATDTADSYLMFNIYDTLVLPNQGAPGHQPHLAESWTVDGNDFIFTLRRDVRFHSGNAMTAEDVVFSFDRLKTLGRGLSYLFANVNSAEAVDDYTVRFNLDVPYSPFIASLVRLPIVDKQLIMDNLGDGDGDGDGEMGDWGQAFLSENGAGTGAYVVVSHNPQEETVMEKNPDYFLGVPDAAPDTVRLRYGLEAATVRTLIAQGEHDISSQWLPPEVLRSMAAAGAQLLPQAGSGALALKMNTTRAPLDDVNCRRAFSAAFDYAAALQMVAITETVSQGSPATGAIPAGMFGANPPEMALQRDMDAAREYLEACEYDPADFTLELSWIAEVPIEERIALLMQSNFAELGFNSEIRRLPWAMFTSLVSTPETTPHFSQLFSSSVTGDPDTLLWPMYHSSVPGTWASPEYLNDGEVDRLLELGRTELTDEGREAAYGALNARLMELAPTIFAFDRMAIYAASNRVRVPVLSEPGQAFGSAYVDISFRLMEMTGQ